MRKLLALILGIVLMVSGGITSNKGIVRAEETNYATVGPSVQLNLGDSVTLGEYTIKFSDISVDYSQVSLTIQGPTGAPSTIIVPEGSNAYYPNSKNPKLVFGAAVWTKDKKPLLYLDIKSPLKKVNGDPLILSAGKSYTLPVGTIKVYKVTSTEVTFTIYLPNNPSKSITLKEGESGGVAYAFPNTDFKYYDFVYVELLDITPGKSAKFNVYMPAVPATKISVSRAGGSSSSSGSGTSTTQTLISLYDGLLYTNEKLTITQNKTKYELQLVSAVSTKASIKVYKDGKALDTYIISIGAIKDIPNTPLKVLISKSEPQYGRVSLTVYGPEDAKATPILRPATIVASIDTVPKTVMVGQDMVIIVTVENKGKGDAYDVNVAAPVPNGFKLVSSVKSWTFKSFPAFTKMPALIYVLQPTKVGKFDIGRVMVTYYDDQSLETGKQKTIYSQPLSGIIVYGLPEIKVSAVASNGTHEGNYVHTEAGKKVLLKFNVSASEGDPNYEFIKNATLQLVFPEGISGEAVIPVGDLKAGSSKLIQASVTVTENGTFPIGAELVYQDPLGREHRGLKSAT